MEFIKKYDHKHYNHTIDKSEEYIGKYNNVNDWIKTLNNDNLMIWISMIILFEKNDNEYYEEYSLSLTLIIKFFMLELEIEDQINLKNKQILELKKKFKHMLFREYSNRNKLNKYLNEYYKFI